MPSLSSDSVMARSELRRTQALGAAGVAAVYLKDSLLHRVKSCAINRLRIEMCSMCSIFKVFGAF